MTPVAQRRACHPDDGEVPASRRSGTVGPTVRAVRQQYHFRPSASGLHAWDVDRLIALADALPEEAVPLTEIVEIESSYWFDHGYEPTVRAVVR